MIKERRPNWTSKQITQKVSQMWNSLPEQNKQTYNRCANLDMERFLLQKRCRSEMEGFNKALQAADEVDLSCTSS